MSILLREGSFRHLRHARARGAAAIEAAVVLVIFVPFLTIPIFYAKVFWHYTAGQKAAQDAARFLASVPKQHMRSSRLAADDAQTAARIAQIEISELSPGYDVPTVEVFCGTSACNGTGTRALPTSVRVLVKMNMYDTIFGLAPTGRYGLAITADATLPYLGADI